MKQAQALDVMKLGHNVFLTGEPGAGKTYVLNEFIAHCREHGIGIGITASTGIAATHIGGMTIHSWSGIGIHSELSDEQLKSLRKKSSLASRFKKTRILIIDEISMLDGARLDLINRVCKAMKDSDKPFGGLQVILCGDLFQLPPVTKGSEEIDYVQSSPAWEELGLKVCYLSEQYRQDEDETLLELLREIRQRDVSQASYDLLKERSEAEFDEEDTTRLYTHNFDVDSLNAERLKRIDDEPRQFQMQTHGQENFIQQLQKSCLAPEVLELKVGAQVLCVANNPGQGFMNGTRGEVADFQDGAPVIRLESGRKVKLERHTWSVMDGERTLAEVSQYPIRLAWAITVHKSQGMNLDAAEVDLSRAFTPGMGYVALSRLRKVDGLFLRGFNSMALEVSPEVSQYDAYLKQQSDSVARSLDKLETKDLDELHRHTRSNLATDYAEYDKDLFETLRQWRWQKARDCSLPPYIVFDDKTLIALSAERPDSQEKLLQVSGVGPKKLEDYGAELLEIINRHSGKLF